MVASVLELRTLEELPDLEKNHDPSERARWVLSAPDPPRLWQDLISSMWKTALPHENKLSAPKNQPKHKLVLSVLQEAFPILRWCQNYNVTKFKADVIAGLTLASLCIPQVSTILHDGMVTN
jgi:low affinity sulfate transporter 2